MQLLNGNDCPTGCLIDGHWGQYGVDRLIDFAADLGWEPEREGDRILLDVARQRLANMGPRLGDFDQHEWITFHGKDHDEDYEADIIEQVIWLSEEIEDWLNNQLPDAATDLGFRFEWYDGEFFLTNMEDDDG